MEKGNRYVSKNWLVLILTLGVFGIINTEMGVVGIIPLIADTFGVTVPQAGWTVSVFALIVAASAPVMPLLFSGVNRRTVMLLALGLFHGKQCRLSPDGFFLRPACGTCASRLPASGLCLDGVYRGGAVGAGRRGIESRLESLCRCIGRDGAGGARDEFHCQPHFL